MRNYLNRFYYFWKDVVVHFINVDGTTRAASLAYTTLLSSVPLAVIGIGILSAFPVFEEYSGRIQSFLITHFVAASADTIHDYIIAFAAKATELSASSVFFVLVAAVMLIFTMESALNTIWRVEARRHGVTAFLIYWAVLTLLPIIAGTAIALSVYLFSLPYFKGAAETIGGVIPFLEMLPFFLAWMGFSALYVTLPNKKVFFRDAVVGALAAAILFEVVKRGFGYYIKYYSTYEIIYGALAALPILLVWIYCSWLIILFGAVVSYIKQTRRELRESQLKMSESTDSATV